MKLRRLKYPFGLILAVVMLVSMASPLFAIADPNYTRVDGMAVFTNVSSTGDQLWVCRYSVNYTTLPTDSASSSFMMAIYTNAGVATGYTVNLNYYGFNLISIYLTSAQALTWSGAYTVKIMGNPAKFPILTENVNMASRALSASDWYQSTSLQSWLTTQVQGLQSDLGQSLISSSNILTTAGASLVLAAIPNINQIIPNFFSATTYYPPSTNTTYTGTGTSNWTSHMGSTLPDALDDIADLFGIHGGQTSLADYVAVSAWDSNKLTIVDITDPTIPSIVATVDSVGGFGLFQFGEYLYAATSNDFFVFDISDPTVPVHVGTGAGLSFSSISVAIDSSDFRKYAYVAGGALYIYDVNNPASPFLVSSLLTGGGTDIFVRGDYAYLVGADGASSFLSVIDISNPTAPVVKGSISGAGAPNYLHRPYSVFVQGNYAYVAAFDDNALTIINISNPITPTFAGSIQGIGAPNYLSQPMSVTVGGNYAYVAAAQDNALTIIDVSNPIAPTFAGSVQSLAFLSFADGVVTYGDYAYVSAAASDALTVVNISNPHAPTITGSVSSATYLGNPRTAGVMIYQYPTGSGWIGIIMTTMLAMMLGGIAYLPNRNPIWAMAFGSLALPIGYWIGFLNLGIAVMIAVGLGIAFAVLFILSRI